MKKHTCYKAYIALGALACVDDDVAARLQKLIAGLVFRCDLSACIAVPESLPELAARDNAAASSNYVEIGRVLNDTGIIDGARDRRAETVVVVGAEERVDPHAAGERAAVLATLQKGTDAPGPALGRDHLAFGKRAGGDPR